MFIQTAYRRFWFPAGYQTPRTPGLGSSAGEVSVDQASRVSIVGGMDDLQAPAWLTKSKLTQFNVSGTVELGRGRLRFPVDGGAASGDQA
jgi:hypothetical protein